MPRVVDHEQRRQELTQHVWALIRSSGIAGVTMRGLSEQSGWSSGAIRHYLPNRQSILTFAAEQLGAEVERYLHSLPQEGTPLQHLEAFLLALLPLDERSTVWMEVWLAFAVAAVRGEAYAESHGLLYADLHKALSSVLDEFKQHGWLPDLTPEQAATELHGLIDGLGVHLLLRQVTPDQARQTVRRALLQMLTGPNAQCAEC